MKLLFVFHPTSYCNLDCTYCWAPDRDNTFQMPLDVAEQSIRQVYSNLNVSQVDFLWLTGEPLVMGIDFFNSTVELCKNLKPQHINISFTIQTNGTLINDDWICFFKENNFTVGVSIDGTKEVHEKQRVNKAGRSTFEHTIRGIDLLIKNGINGGALCVITKNTLKISPDELFFFFYDKKISWSYLIEAIIGENANSKDTLSKEDLPQLRVFLGRLMELWGEYPNSFIRDFDFLAKKFFGNTVENFDFDNLGCLDILNITAKGDFYWGSPELLSATNHELRGIKENIFSTNIFEMRKTKFFLEFQIQIYNGIEKCKRECEYFIGCRGGNPSHKYYNEGRFDVSSHLTCELNEKVISELLLSQIENDMSILA